MHFRWACYYRPSTCLHLALRCWEYHTDWMNRHCFIGSCFHWVLAAGVHYPVRIRRLGSRGSIEGQIVSSSFSCSNYSSFIPCYRLLKSQENTLMTPIQLFLICSKLSPIDSHLTRQGIQTWFDTFDSFVSVMFRCSWPLSRICPVKQSYQYSF